jgi:hypothetical protein
MMKMKALPDNLFVLGADGCNVIVQPYLAILSLKKSFIVIRRSLRVIGRKGIDSD